MQMNLQLSSNGKHGFYVQENVEEPLFEVQGTVL